MPSESLCFLLHVFLVGSRRSRAVVPEFAQQWEEAEARLVNRASLGFRPLHVCERVEGRVHAGLEIVLLVILETETGFAGSWSLTPEQADVPVVPFDLEEGKEVPMAIYRDTAQPRQARLYYRTECSWSKAALFRGQQPD